MNNHKCPFCHQDLNILYDYTVTEYRCELCKLSPYTRYSILYDIFKERYSVSIILNHNEEIYAISIRFDMGFTWLEKLEKATNVIGDVYYLPISILTVDTVLPFNFEDPIQSGQEILNRLLALRVFS